MSTQCIIGIVIAVIAAVAVIVLAFKSRKNKLVEEAFAAPAVETTPDTGKETTIVAESLVEGILDEVDGTIVLPVHKFETAPVPPVPPVPAKTKRKPAVKKDATAVKTKKEPKVKTSKTKTKVTKPATKPATKKAPAKSKNTVEVKVSTKTTGRKTKK